MHNFDFAQKATLLLVDDTPANLALMSDLLNDHYKVKVATGGERALEIVRSGSPPDLILLDIMMPGMDGYAVCKALKSDPQTWGIPIIFLTAKSEPQDEEKGLALGACDYLTKPVHPAVVLSRIHTHLQLKNYAGYLESMVQERTLELEKTSAQLERIIAAGIDLSSEQDDQKLLQRILMAGQNLLQCDAARFFQMKERDSLQLVGHTLGRALPEIKIPLQDAQNGNVPEVVAFCAIHRQTVLIDAISRDTRFDPARTREVDQASHYETISCMNVPMVHRGTLLLGVLQFLNARDAGTGEVVPFSRGQVQFIQSLATLAASNLANLLNRTPP
jgi:CheY-like chemotaxis protein